MVSFYTTMYAIVATGGKQYKVSPGTVLDVERLEGAAGDPIALKAVMAMGDVPRDKMKDVWAKFGEVRKRVMG